MGKGYTPPPEDALNAMKNSKSPGNDGLTEEFYVCFFNEICSSLIDALNYSFEVGQLSTSQRQALITIIEKKDKDKRYIKNWRPISLINVNAKIASKALAARVKKVLASIIKSDQTAYVQGRYIGESIRLISDILEYTEDHGIDGILFSADFEKVFASVKLNLEKSEACCIGVARASTQTPISCKWVNLNSNAIRSPGFVL